MLKNVALALLLPALAFAKEASISYPASRTVDAKDVYHGVEVPDPYRWLEDVKSPEVQEWMKAQDALTRTRLAALSERTALAARFKELFYVDTISAPRHRKGRYFYTRRHANKEKAVVYWKEGKDGAEKVLFDPNGWSTDGSVGLGGWSVSWDGKRVAYQLKKNNSDEATLVVMDVATGQKSDVDTIEGAKYATASWTPSGDGFYYTWIPEVGGNVKVAERPGFAEVRFHKLGQDPKKDVTVHEKTGDATTFLGASLSKDGKWLVGSIRHGWAWNEIFYRKPDDKAWRSLTAGLKAHVDVDVFKDRFYVVTDDGAPKSRAFVVDPSNPVRKAWKEIVPERKDASLESLSVIGGKLVLRYLRNASSLVEVRGLDGKLVRELALPGIGSVGGPSGLEDEDEAYYSFTSYTVPEEIHATSIATGKSTLYARVKVPVDPTPYTVEQAFYPSKDGTKVSVFIVRKKDFKKDGTARLLLYGYGGFNVNQTPAFTSSIYPWLERGGVYAVANLRGGGEYGEDWHKNGMLLKKQNVFDDYVAAAEYLIREKYTSPSKLVIRGGSNGGLLVGAALTQRPDLFRVVLCGVPLLDMVRYHLFGSGKTWVGEYGSSENAEQFKALLAYSPYQKVKKGTKYPSILLLSSDSDDRVDPLHARKMAASLQSATAGGPVLLRIERNAGHGGADLVKASVEARADEYAFALAETAD